MYFLQYLSSSLIGTKVFIQIGLRVSGHCLIIHWVTRTWYYKTISPKVIRSAYRPTLKNCHKNVTICTITAWAYPQTAGPLTQQDTSFPRLHPPFPISLALLVILQNSVWAWPLRGSPSSTMQSTLLEQSLRNCMGIKKGEHTLICVVPGIGMTSSPWASNHAKVTCPAVAACLLANSWRPSTSFKMLGKFSLLNL